MDLASIPLVNGNHQDSVASTVFANMTSHSNIANKKQTFTTFTIGGNGNTNVVNNGVQLQPVKSTSRTNAANKRRKHDSKGGKGLRHFSMKVCEKVRNKGTTTYNIVADELVAEFSNDPSMSGKSFDAAGDGEQEPFDQKNIRRRVYDALNVLMAINIISKEKKDIKWIGLPTNAQQECSELERERLQRLERIKMKKQQLRELLIQQIAFKNLMQRNQQDMLTDPNAIIKLPFIIVNTDKKTLIDCSISRDKSEYLFNFDSTFEIHDDLEVLKRMGLAFDLEKLTDGQAISRVDFEQARQFLPEALQPELDEMIKEKNVRLVN